MAESMANRPILLDRNRVERFFTGGAGLDAWQRLAPGQAYGDGMFSEELLVNTTPYIGPGTPPLQGQSTMEGTGQTLHALLQAQPEAYLGTRVARAFGGQCPVLCKGGDSTGRLILQYHPTQAFASRHLGCAFGKTEAWYMLASRTPGVHYSYVGFQEGVTRARFEALVAADDVPGMLALIHRVPFETGDVLLVPAGTIHAMGPDTTFIEVHEPCDYTLRFERDNYGRRMQDADMHYGLGFATLFDGLTFEGASALANERRVRYRPQPKAQGQNWLRETLLPPAACDAFWMDRLTLAGDYTLAGDGDYALLVALRGDVLLGDDIALPQGRAAFVPAALERLALTSADAQVLLVKPGTANTAAVRKGKPL